MNEHGLAIHYKFERFGGKPVISLEPCSLNPRRDTHSMVSSMVTVILMRLLFQLKRIEAKCDSERNCTRKQQVKRSGLCCPDRLNISKTYAGLIHYSKN